MPRRRRNHLQRHRHAEPWIQGLAALRCKRPSDGSGSFASTPVDVTSAGSSSSTLILTTSATAPLANYALTITATSGSVTHTKRSCCT
jgi:hypothetical protein